MGLRDLYHGNREDDLVYMGRGISFARSSPIFASSANSSAIFLGMPFGQVLGLTHLRCPVRGEHVSLAPCFVARERFLRGMKNLRLTCYDVDGLPHALSWPLTEEGCLELRHVQKLDNEWFPLVWHWTDSLGWANSSSITNLLPQHHSDRLGIMGLLARCLSGLKNLSVVLYIENSVRWPKSSRRRSSAVF